jgi:hypothetical protein
VPSCTREKLHKTVFPDMYSIREHNMADVISEMFKEVNRFYEDEFHHVPDLQHFVYRVTADGMAMEALVSFCYLSLISNFIILFCLYI